MNYRSFASTLFVFLFLCSQTLLAQFEECDPEYIQSITVTDITCNGEENGSIDVLVDSTILGSFSFVWSDPDIGNTSTAFNLDGGNYSLTLSFGPNEGCVVSDSLFVSEPKTLSLECYPAFPIEFMPTNTQIIGVLIGGGTPPFKVDWSGPVSDSKEEPENGETLITGLPPGDYVITVTDVNGCVKTCETTLDCEIDYGISETDPTCFGEAGGRIEIISESTLDYKWSTGATTAAVENLAAGTYKVTITEGDCEKIESITLESPEQIEISIDSTIGDKSRITNTGEAFISLSGGAYPYTYNVAYQGLDDTNDNINGFMSGVSGSVNLNALAYGEYKLTVQDEEGCTDSTRFFIYDVFVVPAGKVFILDYWDNTTKSFYDSVQMSLADKAIKIRSCDCVEGGIERLQLWEAKQELEIYSNGSSSNGKTKGDTSGLETTLEYFPNNGDADNNDNCVYIPAEPNDTAKVIKVALIDSGANMDSELHDQDHPALPGLTWINENDPFPSDGKDDDENCIVDDHEGHDVVNNLNIVIDSVGHGTHIAGIIADRYPADIDLEIINLKVFTQNAAGRGKGNVFDLICAIHYAINNDVDVINLSLGYPDPEYSDPLYRALERAKEKGIMVIAAAGNRGLDLDSPDLPDSSIRWPARFAKDLVLPDSTIKTLDNLLVVAGLDSMNAESPLADLDLKNSNFGKESVHFAARAVYKGPALDGGEVTFRGTSMTAGGITRLISILKAYKPELTIEEIRDTIEASVRTLNNSNRDRLKYGGKLIPEDVLEKFDIDPKLLYRSATEPPKDEQIVYPEGLKMKKGEKMIIRLNKDDGNLLYDDVRFRVFKGTTPTIDFYNKEYCTTNIITWDGYQEDGTTFIPNVGDYFLEFTVAGKLFRPLIRITVIE
jgi:hypothetical protein